MKVSDNRGEIGRPKSDVQVSRQMTKDSLTDISTVGKRLEPSSDYNVDISRKAKRLQKDYASAYQIASATPDVREDKVQELKAKIAEGKYRPDAGKIADAMMAEAIKERLATTS